MKLFVTSDVHIGCRYSLREPFLSFLDGLPPDATLVLNGDTVDYWHRRLTPAQQEVVDRLSAESRRRPLIWVRGNHDRHYLPRDPAAIEFVPSYSVGKRLYIQHGWAFDSVMPYHQWFVQGFRMMHNLRVRLGAEAVHVAFYAKQWAFLYRVLRRSVFRHAVRYARQHGYEAVTCGHTHYAEETVVDGIRYLNTGAWTEQPFHYLAVDDAAVTLKPFVPGQPLL